MKKLTLNSTPTETQAKVIVDLESLIQHYNWDLDTAAKNLSDDTDESGEYDYTAQDVQDTLLIIR